MPDAHPRQLTVGALKVSQHAYTCSSALHHSREGNCWIDPQYHIWMSADADRQVLVHRRPDGYHVKLPAGLSLIPSARSDCDHETSGYIRVTLVQKLPVDRRQ